MMEPEPIDENTADLKIDPVDSLFTIKIYDRHVKESLGLNGELIFEQLDPEYKKFDYSFDFTIKKIKDVQEVALFYATDAANRATRVQFTDGSYVNCTSSHKKFMSDVYPKYFKKQQDYDRYMYIIRSIDDLVAQEHVDELNRKADELLKNNNNDNIES